MTTQASLFSYVVARDYGFAPNPFGGVCTLATCKPEIRRAARLGDWVVGTGSVARNRGAHLVYAMQISEVISYDEYWVDPRFQLKKPNLRASVKLAFGDNIYQRVGAVWCQSDSHHSLPDGTPNAANVARDTKANRVLIGQRFAYWGGSGPLIPAFLRDFQGNDICKKGPGHKRAFPEAMVAAFVEWFESLKVQGYLGRPLDWRGQEA